MALAAAPDFAQLAFFAAIYKFIDIEIVRFTSELLGNVVRWVTSIALVAMTIWVMIQGYRIVTGQSRETAMAVVVNMARASFFVACAMTFSLGSTSLNQFFKEDLNREITKTFTGKNENSEDLIDKNLVKMQLALSAIDAVPVADTDTQGAAQKEKAKLFAGVGATSAPMVAAAMMLVYSFSMALVIGLGPFFILCLVFEQTKHLFSRWLYYGIGTIFSMAMLAVVTTIAMKVCGLVAAALWASKLFPIGDTGLTTMALQQGGVGILMSALIVSVPPLAAMFFQGTLGQATAYTVFSNKPPPDQKNPNNFSNGGDRQAPNHSGENNQTPPLQGATNFQNIPAMQDYVKPIKEQQT